MMPMMWRTVLAESIASLRFYRRRTLVTVLSLGWGVASFVILMSYGHGFDRVLRAGFQAVGQDLVIMAEGQTSEQAGGLRAGRKIRLDLGDVEAIRQAVPYVRAVSPEVMLYGVKAVKGARQKDYTVRAVRPEYELIRNMKMAAGRWLNHEDYLQRNRVAVLGAVAARQLFSGIPPVGEEITLKGLRFTVVGVLDTKAQFANYNTPDNLCIFIPYETAGLFEDLRHPTFIVWTPVNGLVRDQAVKAVRTVLAGSHRFSSTDEKAVFILAFSQFQGLIDGMSIAIRALLGFVGTLTLSIGGVGLANIMLTTVLERTREIGVLKALGGPRSLILKQFLCEALMIIVAGGLLGIAVGVSATYAVGQMPLFGALDRDVPDKGNVDLAISVSSLLVSTGVLFAVGLIAGMIPAIKAARLDPIRALHYE
jgi:putative ABC transport system permease protein